MTQWGKNDTGVTANSTTLTLSSNGAPIGIETLVKGGLTPHGANAHFGNTSPGSRASVDVALFNNTTPSAFIKNEAAGVFGVTPEEVVINRRNGRTISHAGWNIRRAGTGPVVSASYTGTANGYSNGDVVTFASLVPSGNATAILSTNSTGGALTINVASFGFGFTSKSLVGTVANSTGGASTGTGATFNAIVGGRAGRVHFETLVAMGSLGQTANQYGIPATVTSSNTDTTILPTA